MSLFGKREKERIEELEEQVQSLQAENIHAFDEITKLNKENKNLRISQSNLKTANEKLKESNKNYERNLAVLQNTVDSIKKVCKSSKSGVIGKAKILKELGE